MEYTISEVSKKTSLPISTIRYYDKLGLLVDLKKKNGIRKFTDKDLASLYVIECLKKSNLELSEIKEFMKLVNLGDETLEDRRNFFIKQQEKIENKLKELEEVLNLVKYKCWYYQKAVELGSEKKLECEIDSLLTPEIKEILPPYMKNR